MALDVYLWNHDRAYLEMRLGQELAAALSKHGYLHIPDDLQASIQLLLAKHTLRDPKETPLLDNWSGLCALFPSPIHASLSLIRSVLISMEADKTPAPYQHSLYRTGLSVTEFLLDYLNLIGGFHAYSEPNRTDYPHVLLVIGRGT